MNRPDPVPETLMAYLDGELSPEEAREFEKLLEQHPEWREEVAQMTELVDAGKSLAFRPPPAEVWDHYLEEIDERLVEKKFGWAAVAVGGVILAAFGAWKILFWSDNPYIRAGLALLIGGFILLFVAVLRGHLLERPKDRYRRIRK